MSTPATSRLAAGTPPTGTLSTGTTSSGTAGTTSSGTAGTTPPGSAAAGSAAASGPSPGAPPAAPGRRGRRALRAGPSRRRTAAGAALIVLTVAAGTWVDRFTPVNGTGFGERQEALQRPFVTSGPMGAPVAGRHYAVTVHGVSGAGTLREERFGEVASRATTGVWLLVEVTVVARDEPASIGYATVRDAGGRVFHATSRVTQRIVGGREFQPGVEVRGVIVFEVPRASAETELTLVTAQSPSVISGHYYLEHVEVELRPPSSDQLAAWARASVTLPEGPL